MNFMPSEQNFTHDKDRDTFIVQSVRSLCEGKNHFISNAANISALLFKYIPNINWVGFYFLHNNTLLLGPFHGKVACTHIPIGKGVCGTAIVERKIQRIKNVHDFPGHIACDSASNSEIVIPLWHNGNIIGVLDIDSPHFARFSASDEILFTQITEIYCEFSDFSFYSPLNS